MPVDRVLIDFRKYPDQKHWQYELSWLAEDDYGVWFWGAPGTAAQRGDEAPITFDSVIIQLISRDWWAAAWRASGEPEVYVDIVAPAVWREGRVTMIDLDLDVSRARSGRVRIHDEDEFAEHQVALAYPQELVEGAVAACERVRTMIVRGDEPFATAGAARLAEALALQRQTGA